MLAQKPISFDHGYRFFDALKLAQIGSEGNFIVGLISEEKDPDAIFFGKIAEFDGLMGKNVWFDTKGAHVIYIIGKRRGGKSFTLGTLAEGLCSETFHIGNIKQAVLILDTLNIFWTMENETTDTEQLKELDKWGLKPEPMKNIVCYYPRGLKKPYTPSHYREFALKPADLEGSDWAALFGVDPILDPMGQLLTELHEKVAIEGYKAAGSQVKPNPNYSVSDLLLCLNKDREIQRFAPQTIEAVRRYLKAVERSPFFSSTGTDVRDIFKKGQVTVLLLRDLDQQIRGLIIGLLIKKIMKLRGETVECEKRLAIKKKASQPSEKSQSTDDEIDTLQKLIENGLPRGWVLIDEAHNYIPQTGIIGSKEPLKKYVNEGRNIGLSIAVTTQQPSGLDSAIRRNADILVIHSITMSADLEATESMLNASVPKAVAIARTKVESHVFENMVRELKIGYAIISSVNANRVFLVKVRPRVTAHGGVEY
jgi:hypothetical protein